MSVFESIEPMEFRPLDDGPSFDEVFNEPEPLPEEVQNGEPLAIWCFDPLVNIYREKGPCYLWLRFVPGWPEVDLEEFYEDSIGPRPKWLDEEISNSGLDMIIDVPHHAAGWMIEEGLSPGQPFCVEVYPPHWSKVSYEYNEWDCDWYWNIVRRMPCKPLSAASAWQRLFDGIRREEEKQARARERVRQKRMQDSKALYFRWESYWSHGYSDGEMPGGTRVSLCSDHTSENNRSYFSYEMFSAEHRDGDKAEAMNKLVERAYKEGLLVRTKWERLRRPTAGIFMSEEAFRKLPVRFR